MLKLRLMDDTLLVAGVTSSPTLPADSAALAEAETLEAEQRAAVARELRLATPAPQGACCACCA